MKVICIFAYVTYLIIRAQGGWQKFLLVRNTKWQKWVFGGGMKAFGLRELNSRSTSNHSAFHAAQPLLLPSSFLFFSWLLSRPSLLTRLRSPSEPLLPSSRPFSESCLSQLVSENWTLDRSRRSLVLGMSVVFDWSTFTVDCDSGDNSLVNSSKRSWRSLSLGGRASLFWHASSAAGFGHESCNVRLVSFS